jgi:ABC-type branched-subunit amino acid transport system substrate-binding protein
VATRLRALVGAGAVDAVVGWHLSSVRQAVAPVLAGRVPYVYATAYEGGEVADGVLCSGELPAEQVVSALRWLRGEFGWRRWFLVGDDYVWPRQTARRVSLALHDAGVEITGSRYVPLGCADDDVWRSVVAEVARSGADGAVMLLVGSDGVRFNREFARAGLDASVVRFSPFMDETMLLASGPETTGGLYASAGWFAGLATASALEFTAGFATAFDDLVADPAGGPGPDGEPAPVRTLPVPSPGTMAETTYSALHLLADLGRRSVPDVLAVRRARTRCAWDSPHGTVDLRDGRAGHPVHVARADGVSFDVLSRVSGAGHVPHP